VPDDSDKPDSDLTPTASPEAKRRRSSQNMAALVKCPACNSDARVDCDLCINETTGLNTRFVTSEKAAEWLQSNRPTPVVPKP
jgi:hypothetical protein